MLKIPILLSLQKLYNLFCHNNGSTNAQQICLQFNPNALKQINYLKVKFYIYNMLKVSLDFLNFYYLSVSLTVLFVYFYWFIIGYGYGTIY